MLRTISLCLMLLLCTSACRSKHPTDLSHCKQLGDVDAQHACVEGAGAPDAQVAAHPSVH